MQELIYPETQISYNFLIKFWHGIKHIHCLPVLQCTFQLHVTALGDGTSHTTIHRRNKKANMHAGILKFSSSVYIPM